MLGVRENLNSNQSKDAAVLQKLPSDGTFNESLCLNKEWSLYFLSAVINLIEAYRLRRLRCAENAVLIVSSLNLLWILLGKLERLIQNPSYLFTLLCSNGMWCDNFLLMTVLCIKKNRSEKLFQMQVDAWAKCSCLSLQLNAKNIPSALRAVQLQMHMSLETSLL